MNHFLKQIKNHQTLFTITNFSVSQYLWSSDTTHVTVNPTTINSVSCCIIRIVHRLWCWARDKRRWSYISPILQNKWRKMVIKSSILLTTQRGFRHLAIIIIPCRRAAVSKSIWGTVSWLKTVAIAMVTMPWKTEEYSEMPCMKNKWSFKSNQLPEQNKNLHRHTV